LISPSVLEMDDGGAVVIPDDDKTFFSFDIEGSDMTDLAFDGPAIDGIGRKPVVAIV